MFTVNGKYTTRGWTEWTQGFSVRLGDPAIRCDWRKAVSRTRAIAHAGTHGLHVSHVGVHDHGFNNVSTYGNLLRLMWEGRIEENDYERHFYELALKISGAVQAARWTGIADGKGYIYSFNGPHSLFIDTMRSLRALGVAHQLGHALMGERDRKISLLDRILQHGEITAEFAIYYGKGRRLRCPAARRTRAFSM